MTIVRSTTTRTTEAQRDLLAYIADDETSLSFVRSSRLAMAKRLCKAGYLTESSQRVSKGGLFSPSWNREVVAQTAFSTDVILSPGK